MLHQSESSKGGGIRGHGAGEGHTVNGHSFLPGVGRRDGASQRRRDGWLMAACVSLVETGQRAVLLLFHLQLVPLQQCTANAQSVFFFHFCPPFLGINLDWFGAKNPVCWEENVLE